MLNQNFDRHRRLRNSAAMRDLVRETVLHTDDLIYPIFVKEGQEPKTEVTSMPGVFQFPLHELESEVATLIDLGIKAIILFGLPDDKDDVGSGAYHDHGIVQEAIRLVKRVAPEMIVIADTCLCEFTDHGHCGIFENGDVENDKSLELLKKNSD